MKLGITKLEFVLPKNPFGPHVDEIDSAANELSKLELRAGTGNKKFEKAYSEVVDAVESGNDLFEVLDKPLKVRALAVSLQYADEGSTNLTNEVLQKINDLRPSPTSLLIQSVYQYYLTYYDELVNYRGVGEWILSAMKQKGLHKYYHDNILTGNGPKWIAQRCIDNDVEFENEIRTLELENYSAGRFLLVAKSIYYVEQLNTIPVNEPNSLLGEVQQQAVYESRYDDKYLLGHKVLQILIDRAPNQKIDDTWLNTIMIIGGDPRIAKSHPNYQKWWSKLDDSLIDKFRGWLSRLDLRLFLEALKDYSYQPGKSDLKRMFPSRKNFLEGLLNKNLITNTRLYLSYGAAAFLKRNYKAEHLPDFSRVTDGDRSIIHVQLGGAHMIEGSHSCYLWIYKRLDPSAVVFNYSKKAVRYSELTQDMSYDMIQKGAPPQDNITHNPISYSWQHKAIRTLKDIGVNISAKDVLSDKDYSSYKRLHGVS